MNDQISKIDVLGQQAMELAVKVRQALTDFPQLEGELKTECIAFCRDTAIELTAIKAALESLE